MQAAEKVIVLDQGRRLMEGAPEEVVKRSAGHSGLPGRLEAMLEVSGIDVFRGETQVLWEVSLEVHLGERVAILGSNGAGKSSLLAAITGTLPPRRGTIAFKGESLVGMKPHQITQLGVALVPEGRRVYRDMTVAENLEMGAYPKRGRAQLQRTMEHVLHLFPVLG